jgi:protease-4
MNKELLQILSGAWLIDESAIVGAIPLITKYLNGAEIKDIIKSEEKPVHSYPVSISPKGAVESHSSLDDAPEGSISVLKIKNVLVKPDYYGLGMSSLGKIHKSADAHPNIVGHVLFIDSPGGTVDGTEEFAQIIKSSLKPVVVFVDGLMASAAYWIGSSAQKIILNGKTARVGSVGTMLGVADFNGILEKYGAKFHNVRATDSSEKNEAFYQLMQGNYKPVREEVLDPLNDVFLSSVDENRNGKVKKTALKGKTFIGESAIEQGLADSIGTFEDAVKAASELANQSKSNNKTKNTMKLNKNLVAIAAFFGFSAAVDEQDMPVLTDNHLEKLDAKLKALEDANAALVAEKETLVYEKATLTADLATSRANEASLTTDLETANNSIKDLTAKVEEYGDQPGAKSTKPINNSEKIDDDKPASYFDPEAEHNKINFN